jgi:hypothetical protein
MGFGGESVLIVPKIPLAIRLRMTAIPATAETNSAGAGGLPVQGAGDKRASPGASPAEKCACDLVTGIVNADFARVAPFPIGALSAFGDFPADLRESRSVPAGGFPRLETFPRHVLAFAHFESPELILDFTAFRAESVEKNAASGAFLDYSIGGKFDK